METPFKEFNGSFEEAQSARRSLLKRITKYESYAKNDLKDRSAHFFFMKHLKQLDSEFLKYSTFVRNILSQRHGNSKYQFDQYSNANNQLCSDSQSQNYGGSEVGGLVNQLSSMNFNNTAGQINQFGQDASNLNHLNQSSHDLNTHESLSNQIGFSLLDQINNSTDLNQLDQNELINQISNLSQNEQVILAGQLAQENSTSQNGVLNQIPVSQEGQSSLISQIQQYSMPQDSPVISSSPTYNFSSVRPSLQSQWTTSPFPTMFPGMAQSPTSINDAASLGEMEIPVNMTNLIESFDASSGPSSVQLDQDFNVEVISGREEKQLSPILPDNTTQFDGTAGCLYSEQQEPILKIDPLMESQIIEILAINPRISIALFNQLFLEKTGNFIDFQSMDNSFLETMFGSIPNVKIIRHSDIGSDFTISFSKISCYNFKETGSCECGLDCDGKRGRVTIGWRTQQCAGEMQGSKGCGMRANCNFLHTLTLYR